MRGEKFIIIISVFTSSNVDLVTISVGVSVPPVPAIPELKSVSLSLTKCPASLPVVSVPVVVVPVGGVTAVVGSGSKSGVTPGVPLLSVPEVEIEVAGSSQTIRLHLPIVVVHSPGVGPYTYLI